MGKGKKSARITRKDIAKAESLTALIADLVKRTKDGNAEDKESAVTALRSLATQDHGEHAVDVFKAGAVKPLVAVLKVGSNDAQANASGALAAIAVKKPEHQQAIVEAGGIPPLVSLLRMGGCKVQEEVRFSQNIRSMHHPRIGLASEPCLVTPRLHRRRQH